LAWAGLRDVSEDRVVLLGEAWYQAYMKDAVTDAGRRLIHRAREAGDRVVIVSENIEPIIRLLATDLGADGYLCNRLEWRHGRATGRLVDPMITAYTLDQVRAHAQDHGADLGRCAAYGATEADAVLLGAVGRPCAVRPDAGLRRIARDMNWPIVVDGGP
jgi:phosphoserine phosphatase